LKSCSQPGSGGKKVKVKVYGYASSANFAECDPGNSEQVEINSKLNGELAQTRRHDIAEKLRAALQGVDSVSIEEANDAEVQKYVDRNLIDDITTAASAEATNPSEMLNRTVAVEITDTGRCEFTGAAVIAHVDGATTGQQ
jgi:hypothetical protein